MSRSPCSPRCCSGRERARSCSATSEIWTTAGACSGSPTSKTDAGRRTLEVPEALRPLLLALARDRIGAAPLFRDRHGERPSRFWLAYHCRKLCRRAMVPDVTPHGLRGTHGSLARRGGATGELVAAQLGHASTAITEGTYVLPEAAQAADARAVALRVVKGGRSP
jgi:integrase